MKKVAVITLSLILILTILGCSTQKSSVENQQPSGQASETSNNQAPSLPKESTAETKISISPPSGWNPVTGSVLPVQYMKNTASFMVKEENYFSAKNIDDVVKEAKTAFEKSFKDVAYIGDTETITVDGLDARKLIFTSNISNMQMKYEYVYLFVDEKVYAITFGDLAKTFDSLTADFGQILKDIKFE